MIRYIKELYVRTVVPCNGKLLFVTQSSSVENLLCYGRDVNKVDPPNGWVLGLLVDPRDAPIDSLLHPVQRSHWGQPGGQAVYQLLSMKYIQHTGHLQPLQSHRHLTSCTANHVALLLGPSQWKGRVQNNTWFSLYLTLQNVNLTQWRMLLCGSQRHRFFDIVFVKGYVVTVY